MEYRELSVEEAWELFSVGAPVERQRSYKDIDAEWRLVRDRYGGPPDNFVYFLECYKDSGDEYKFRIEVE